MKTKLTPLWLAAVFLLSFGVLRAAGPISNAGTLSVALDGGGNNATNLAIPYSSNTVILVSSAPADANLGITEWRYREIVNAANGRMMILSNNTDFTSFSSTKAIVLSSDTAGSGQGDSYVVPHQGKVWAIWGPETTNGGAAGSESYQH